MRTYSEIEMIRDERGVWSAPWERGQTRTTAGDQAASVSAEPAGCSTQEKRSWREFLHALLPVWKERSERLSHQAA